MDSKLNSWVIEKLKPFTNINLAKIIKFWVQGLVKVYSIRNRYPLPARVYTGTIPLKNNLSVSSETGDLGSSHSLAVSPILLDGLYLSSHLSSHPLISSGSSPTLALNHLAFCFTEKIETMRRILQQILSNPHICIYAHRPCFLFYSYDDHAWFKKRGENWWIQRKWINMHTLWPISFSSSEILHVYKHIQGSLSH